MELCFVRIAEKKFQTAAHVTVQALSRTRARGKLNREMLIHSNGRNQHHNFL